jgi:predicted transcriptional regulator
MNEVYTGEHMKALRLEKGFEVVNEWAELLGCSRNTIYAVEESKVLTCAWRLTYIALKDGNLLSILWQLKKQR